MERINLKGQTASKAFSTFLFLFAMQPALEHIKVSDYMIWGAMLICILIALYSIVHNLIKDKKSLIVQLCSTNLYSRLDIALAILGLAVSLYFHSYLYRFWIAMAVLDISALFIPDYFKKEKQCNG